MAIFEQSSASPIAAATDWIVALFTGSLVTGLSILAVAAIGIMMIAGRLPLKSAIRAILGCFVLLGAPVIASAFLSYSEPQATFVPEMTSEFQANPREDLQPADVDPYAGASLRQD